MEEIPRRHCGFFRSLGLEAKTDYSIEGARTKHNIDVYVVSNHVGFDAIWLIECKHWARPVSKLHVLAFREIVSDVGADKGIILSEEGFQKGAIEAANLTNVEVNSLAKLKGQTENAVYSMRLRDLAVRLTACEQKYWDIPKNLRIEFDLRSEEGRGIGYSGNWVIETCKSLLFEASKGEFPISTDYHFAKPDLIGIQLPEKLHSNRDVYHSIDQMVQILERKIQNCLQAI